MSKPSPSRNLTILRRPFRTPFAQTLDSLPPVGGGRQVKKTGFWPPRGGKTCFQRLLSSSTIFLAFWRPKNANLASSFLISGTFESKVQKFKFSQGTFFVHKVRFLANCRKFDILRKKSRNFPLFLQGAQIDHKVFGIFMNATEGSRKKRRFLTV